MLVRFLEMVFENIESVTGFTLMTTCSENDYFLSASSSKIDLYSIFSINFQS